MALPASGVPELTPGQAPQPTGVWRHTVTGDTLTVEHPAAADALAAFRERNERGNYVNSWEYVGPAEETASEAQSRVLEENEGDEFSVTTTASGKKQFRKNGKLVSKAQFDKEAPSASDAE